MSKANQWRARAREKRTIELELPSGMTVKFCRPNLGIWMTNGRVPESLVATLSKILASQTSETHTLALLTADDLKAYAQFLNDLVIESVLEPKIVLTVTDEENEIGIAELPDDDIQFLIAQALNLSPGVPVQTKEGDITVSDVERFRNEPERHISAVPGGHGTDVWSPTV